MFKHINDNNQNNKYKKQLIKLISDLIKLFDFDPNMLKLDKKKQTFKGINTHYIGYVTKKEEEKLIV